MASDSDVEAYLNQLSKKTFSLQNDIDEPWQDDPSPGGSSPSDRRRGDSSRSDESDLPEQKHRARYQQKKAPSGSLSDIAALSDKYSNRQSKTVGSSQAKFNTLEQKYLRKSLSSKHSNTNVSLKANNAAASAIMIKSVSSHNKRPDARSDISSVDEELINYLNEASLLESPYNNSCSNHETHTSDNGDDSMDGVLNVKNILTVENLLDQIPNINDTESSSQSERGKQKSVSVKAKKLKSLSTDNDENSFISGIQKSAQSTIRQSTSSHSEEKDNNYEKPVGMLLAQASNNIFRSSRRKSSIEFNVESLAKLQPRQKDMIEPEVVSEENITTSSETNVLESVVKTEASEEDQSVEEHLTNQSRNRKLSLCQRSPTKPIEKKHTGTQAGDVASLDAMAAHISSDNLSEENISSVSVDVKDSSLQKNASYSSFSKSSGSSHRISKELSDRKDKSKLSGKNKITRNSPKSLRKTRKKERSKKKKKQSHKWVSSESSESSSSDSSESEVKRHHYRRRHRSHSFDPRYMPAYVMHPPSHYCHHVYGSNPHVISTNFRPGILEGYRVSSEALEVDQVMRQQVALTRQFLDSQRVMYQAYTDTLLSTHRYTTLYNTEKYIKKKQQPPLTFKEAYRLVKEEMESSER